MRRSPKRRKVTSSHPLTLGKSRPVKGWDISIGGQQGTILEKKVDTSRLRSIVSGRPMQDVSSVSAVSNVFCATGDGGGVDPTCPVHSPRASSAHVAKVHKALTKGERPKDGLTLDRVKAAISNAPPKVQELLANNLKSVKLYTNTEKDRYKSDLDRVGFGGEFDPTRARGFYTHEHGTAMVLDNNLAKILAGKAHPKDHQEVLLHELGHTIDFSHSEYGCYSEQPGWQKAWKKEIVKEKGITDYAQTNSDEGFAEFTRMVFQVRGVDPKAMKRIEKDYPLCVAYFKANGLW